MITMNNLISSIWHLQLNDTMIFALALIIAGLIGEGLCRFARLPRVSGYSLAGLLLGPLVLGWFDTHNISYFRIVIDLALAMLLFELGNRVDLHWFKVNHWIIPASIIEAGLTFIGAFAVLRLFDATPGFAATVAAIAIGTSPAIVTLGVAELRAEGQITQRLFVFTALNVLYSVVLSKIIVGAMHGTFRGDWIAAVLHPVYLLSGSLLVGLAIAVIVRFLRRGFSLSDAQTVVILFGLLLLSITLLQAFALPTMLAPLLAGVIVKNSDRRPILWPQHFGSIGDVLVILLFVLTSASLTLPVVSATWLVALTVIAVRAIGKSAGMAIVGPASGISLRQSFTLGLALLPMSAVAFLLVDDIRNLYPEFGTKVGAVVFCMIALMQFLGPICVQWALRFSNESTERE